MLRSASERRVPGRPTSGRKVAGGRQDAPWPIRPLESMRTQSGRCGPPWCWEASPYRDERCWSAPYCWSARGWSRSAARTRYTWSC